MNRLFILALSIAGICGKLAVSQEAWEDSWRKATAAAKSQDFSKAVEFAKQAKELGFRHPSLDYQVGRWSFRAGDFKNSLKSFDQYLANVPTRSNSLWERGISCYYAGEFKAGAQQFVDYQKYHDNDVENAVWRYLCQMKVDGKEKTRKSILPIKNDRRVPMMEVYRLFKGELAPDDVLRALEASQAKGDDAKVETMHAHLYLGLYFDSEGQPEKALEHIRTSAKQFKSGSYMWSVAVVHEKRLAKKSRK